MPDIGRAGVRKRTIKPLIPRMTFITWGNSARSEAVSVAIALVFTACQTDEFQFKSPFPHAAHTKQGIECALCHRPDSVVMSYPSPQTCSFCHTLTDKNDIAARVCKHCHQLNETFAASTQWIQHRHVEKIGLPVPESFRDVQFEHGKFANSDPECLACHAVKRGNTITAVRLPAMNQAMQFFVQHGQGTPNCSVCHTQQDDTVEPESHQSGNWLREHGQVIRFEGNETCTYCHTENACTTCHEQMKPQSHTALFRTQTHGLEAEWGRETCMTCHRIDFCQACHSEVTPRSHTAGFGSPMNNHCIHCHVERGENSRCYACHDLGQTDAIHATEAPYPSNPVFIPVHVHGAPCIDCHLPSGIGLGPPVKHPLVLEENCTICHTFR